MVYKNKDLKKDKLYYRKLIFSVLLIIYFAGLCAGCAFALKNTDNFDFVKKVTFIENLANVEKSSVLAHSVRFLLRDIILIISVIIFKYSGILKGLCLCVPFIMAVQNSCLYTVLMYQVKTGIFNLIFHYILKDTAVSFVVIIYTFIIINELLRGRERPQKDIRRTFVYIRGIFIIYVIDFAVKSFIFPFR